jgi:uncharacterized protein (DUF1684 family)
MSPYEALADYRRRVGEVYRGVREGGGNPETHSRFIQERDRLFGEHPQSALSDPQKARFQGLSYFPYDPALRFALPVDTEVEPEVRELELSENDTVRLRSFGRVRFSIGGVPQNLSLFWILGYGGGRYLLDTIKHADLGEENGKLILDFSFAYNPSCAYNPRWSCPLAPRENHLLVPIRAGEKAFSPTT